MSQSSKDFDEFMKQREEASDAFVNGAFNPLDKISVQDSGQWEIACRAPRM